MTRSDELFSRARAHIPGGVNSPVRAFAAVGGTPPFIASADGAWITDEDGHRYVDYVGSWGPMILGHQHPAVVAALEEQLRRGVSYGAPTTAEVEMADFLCDLLPGMDMVRMVNSGTEATMSSLRLARGYTGRDTIVKFEGCYHGHGDSLLVKAGSGALTFGVPTSPGVPADLARHTLTLPYNDADAVRALFAERGDDIAAIIVEPIAGNMNCITPRQGFLETLREACSAHGAVLIFDEVMTGFRVSLRGAQGLYGIQPDLTTLGKIVGGGLPVGAFGGRADIMQHLAPTGPVYQAGTLSGNPLAMSAGLATLRALTDGDPYPRLAERTEQLLNGLQECADDAGVPFCTRQVGSMFGLFFGLTTPPNDLTEVQAGDLDLFNHFFHAMLERGVYLAPSAFEAGFVSAAHGDAEIQHTLDAAAASFHEAMARHV